MTGPFVSQQIFLHAHTRMNLGNFLKGGRV